MPPGNQARETGSFKWQGVASQQGATSRQGVASQSGALGWRREAGGAMPKKVERDFYKAMRSAD